MADLSRREFLRTTPALFLAPTLFCRTESAPVHIALVFSPDYTGVRRGVEVSVGEVQRAAALLGRAFSFTAVPAADFAWQPAWTGLIRATSRGAFNAPDLPVVDVTGSAVCTPNIVQLRADRRDCPNVGRCVEWHHSLERFGAAQLNARFAAAGIDRIDAQTWLGWFAVKCLWESSLRNKPPRELQFDGHKGMPLEFASGVLMQPVYELTADGASVLQEIRPRRPYRVESVHCL